MRVLGIGIDLVQNSRIEHIITKNYAERFIKKFLHPQELDTYFSIQNDNEQVQFLASRWAVKEAAAKAIGRKELVFNQIIINKDNFGKPILEFEGNENQRLLLELQIARCHISFSHEKDYTIATALVEEYQQ